MDVHDLLGVVLVLEMIINYNIALNLKEFVVKKQALPTNSETWEL